MTSISALRRASKVPSSPKPLRPQHIVVLLAVMVATVLIALVGYDMRREYVSAIDEARATTQNLARVLEEHTRQSLRRVEVSLERAAGDLLDAGGIERGDSAALTRILGSLLPPDGLIRAFAIIDRDGHVVASTTDVPGELGPSGRDYFVEPRDRADVRLTLGAPTHGRATGKWRLPVSLRLGPPNGEFGGVLLALVEPKYFQDFYDSIDTGTNGFVTLFQRDGWIVTRSPHDDRLLTRNWSDAPMFRVHLPAANANTVRQVVAADGVERIYSYRALEDYPVIASLGLSLTDRLAPWRARAWHDIGILLALLSALGAATWGLRRQFTRQEAAAETMSEDAARLKLTTGAANVGLWDWDFRTNAVHFSPEWKGQLGYRDDEVRNDFSEWQDRIHPQDLQRTLDQIQAFIAKPSPDYASEIRMRHKDGSYRWIRAQAALFADKAGAPIRMMGTHTDVTLRKESEAQLRKSEETLRLVTDTMEEVFWVADVGIDNNFYISPAYERVWGRTRASLREDPKSFLQAVHPEDLDHVLATLEREKSGNPFDHEFRIIRPDGTIRWIRDRGYPIRDGINVTRYAGVAQDITERKQAEDELRASHTRLRAILDSMFAFVALLSRDGIVLEANAAPLRFVGLRREDVIGSSFSDGRWWNHSPAMRIRVRMALSRAASGEVVREDLTVLGGDGRIITLDATFGPLRDARGEVTEIVGSAVDVTDKRRGERTLQALARRTSTAQETERGRFARELHDEIGQALTAVRLNLQAVGRSRSGPSRRLALDDGIAIADEAIERVRSMSLELRPQVLDDLGLAPALEWYCARQAKRAGLPIDLEIQAGMRAAKGASAVACYRIAQEAITNALRHAQARSVQVELAWRDGVVVLEIADDGVGFDAGKEPDIEAIGILGMRERAELAGGILRIESLPGAGTRVRAEVPLKAR